MIKKITYLILLLLQCNFIWGQDPIYSQFTYDPIYLNPGLAGINNNYKLSVHERLQWSRIPSQFNTTTVAFDSWQDFNNFGVSALYTKNNEGEGSLKTSTYSVGGAYRLFDKNQSPLKFQMGAQYHHITKRIDWSKLVFSDELDPIHGDVFASSFSPPTWNSYKFNNFSVGAVLIYRLIEGKTRFRRRPLKMSLDTEFGFAIHHLIQREDGFIYKENLLPIKYTGHGSVLFVKRNKRGPSTAIKNKLMYQEQGGMKTLQYGIEGMMYPFHFGAFYRHQVSSINSVFNKKESYGFMLGYRKLIGSNLAFTFSYSRDLTASKLNYSTNGINELILIIESVSGGLFSGKLAEKRKDKAKNRQIPCYDKFKTQPGTATPMGDL